MTFEEPWSDDGSESLELPVNWSQMKDVDGHRMSRKGFLSDVGITHTMAPGEAHTRLGAVERRHQLLRKSVEIYMHDRGLNTKDGIKTALSYIMPQINSSCTVAAMGPGLSTWFCWRFALRKLGAIAAWWIPIL